MKCHFGVNGRGFDGCYKVEVWPWQTMILVHDMPALAKTCAPWVSGSVETTAVTTVA